ncbi:MAG TPA: site-2 protease family protein [Candidatus Paceibacterota bacterium]
MSVILFIIILGILIFAHELGHFLAAKKFKIRVDEFALGFPPRVWAKKFGETVYALNILPLGGYVKIYGEDGDDGTAVDPKSSRKMSDAPRWKQAIILSSGIIGNIIFAWLILSIGFMAGLPTASSGPFGDRIKEQRLIITSIMPDSPAEDAGLKAGDQILAIQYNAETINNPDAEKAISLIGNAPDGSQIDFSILRQETTSTISAITEEGIVSAGKSGVGVSMEYIGTLQLSPIYAMVAGGYATVEMSKQVGIGLYSLIVDSIRGQADLSTVTGPVGIASLVGDAGKNGLASLLLLTAIISINLAAINLIPFPALDGGRLFFLAIEAVRRKALNPKFSQRANQIGFVLLLLLMAIITYKDIIRLIK